MGLGTKVSGSTVDTDGIASTEHEPGSAGHPRELIRVSQLAEESCLGVNRPLDHLGGRMTWVSTDSLHQAARYPHTYNKMNLGGHECHRLLHGRTYQRAHAWEREPQVKLYFV